VHNVKSLFQFVFTRFSTYTHTHVHTHSTVRLWLMSAAILEAIAGARTDRSQNPASRKKYIDISVPCRVFGVCNTGHFCSCCSLCQCLISARFELPCRNSQRFWNENQNTTPTRPRHDDVYDMICAGYDYSGVPVSVTVTDESQYSLSIIVVQPFTATLALQ